jgi:hypothetical protein
VRKCLHSYSTVNSVARLVSLTGFNVLPARNLLNLVNASVVMMATRVVLTAVCQSAIRPVGKHITATKENVTLGTARLCGRLDPPTPHCPTQLPDGLKVR